MKKENKELPAEGWSLIISLFSYLINLAFNSKYEYSVIYSTELEGRFVLRETTSKGVKRKYINNEYIQAKLNLINKVEIVSINKIKL